MLLGLIVSFLLGAIIGSFLNVLILRYNTGRSLGGRSGCLSCGKKLRWSELIPIVSFLWQKGKCVGCRSRVSWQYPIVESSTGFLFALIFWSLAPTISLIIFYWLVAGASGFIIAYDWKHQIIPDRANYFLFGLAVLRVLFFGPSLIESVLTGLAFFLIFWALWYFSDGRWLGFGDAKLVLSLGLLLGASAGVTALCLAFWLGAIIGLTLIAFGRVSKLLKLFKRYTMKSEVPFAPFLLLGAWLTILFQLNVFFFF